jgi:lipopolysaccharide transport system ATP-binding protein
VKRGEAVAIVGRNGAGKSTLLKVLSRIVEPTAGRVEVRGRMGSLLEVGTGFHPELTGRENIYLNGSVLGMKRAEITRKFNEIVAFSGVEQFLDTPVKRYSSGMSVRLAFAVAAYLEPEILVIDEVLAVGDAAFQKRCLAKLSEVARSGQTVLLVSHNTGAVRTLCKSAVLLDRGSVIQVGATDDVLTTYLNHQQTDAKAEYDLSETPRAVGKRVIMRKVRLLNAARQLTRFVMCGHPLTLEFDLRLPQAVDTPQVGVGVDDHWGQRVFSVGSFLAADDLPALPAGDITVRCHIPAVPLTPGRYTLSLSVGYTLAELVDQVEGVVVFDVEPGDFFGNGRLPSRELGQTLVRSEWAVSGEEP